MIDQETRKICGAKAEIYPDQTLTISTSGRVGVCTVIYVYNLRCGLLIHVLNVKKGKIEALRNHHCFLTFPPVSLSILS